MAQPAAAPADPPSALLEAARSIRAVLARGAAAQVVEQRRHRRGGQEVGAEATLGSFVVWFWQ